MTTRHIDCAFSHKGGQMIHKMGRFPVPSFTSVFLPINCGLTRNEKKNKALVDEYAQNYVTRKNQTVSRITQDISGAYRTQLQMRYQMLRDLREVCATQNMNCGYNWIIKSFFIQECEKKQIEYETEMYIMELGFPWLAKLDAFGKDDI